MSYREIQPPAEVANGIECVWTRRAGDASSHANESGADQECAAPRQTHNVLPDGAMDIIATLNDDGSLDNAFVVGAMTRPVESQLSHQSLVGIRFLPSVGGSALGINASELTDELCELGDLYPAKSHIFGALRALITNPNDARVFRQFADQLGMQRRSMPSLVRVATQRLAESPHRVRVEHVARDLGVTRQHLARIFSAHSGLSPKQFSTICRVRALLAEVQETVAVERARSITRVLKNETKPRRQPVEWSSIAAHYGYADQSHLIADVRSVTGMTPGAWERLEGSNIPIVRVPVGAL